MTARIVITGPDGSGAHALAQELGAQLGLSVVDGDSLAQDTQDPWAWLAKLRNYLRASPEVVVSCGGLSRQQRNQLRCIDQVRLVVVHGPTGDNTCDQALEADESDVIRVCADLKTDQMVRVIQQELTVGGDRDGAPALLVDAGEDREITGPELQDHLAGLVVTEITGRGARRVLLVPPDHTRLYSRAGEITGILYKNLTERGCDVSVLPALGTHVKMTPQDCDLLFGDTIPYDRILHHEWKEGLTRLGEISAEEIEVLSQGRYADSVPVEVDGLLLEDWDMVVSIGQVVPHEVIGMANFTKNIVIGLGGAPTVHRSHFLGAASDMETIMGRAISPVRDMVDAAFDRFIADRVDVLWILTVMEDAPNGVINRGLFAGRGRSCESGGAAYRQAAMLSATCNIDQVETEFERVACWLDPKEFRSTWLGNKAVYRTRMAIADGGELVVLAPGVSEFGEDSEIDRLIRLHGYRGLDAALEAMESDPDLVASLGAAAHLIHGSSEGRFGVVYCTDPGSGGLSQQEVESVGFAWRPLAAELAMLEVDGGTRTGFQTDVAGEKFMYIANPALGLWAASSRFARNSS